MPTIDKIDFTKLKTYDGKTSQSFEQMCYQIALKEYGHLGKFTPIDGSGGDGGVEFYLTLNTGEKWGWQCKFFGDNGRLNSGSRKVQITKSLETACRNHSDLTKWILCLKTDLTEDSLSNNEKLSKGERSWFENELTQNIPKERNVVLEHWGESTFLTFLKETKHNGIRNFFFGELEFNQDWFKQKFEENFVNVKDKYDPELHTIDQYFQSLIDCTLLNSNYAKTIVELKQNLQAQLINIENELQNFRFEVLLSDEEYKLREKYFLKCKEFYNYSTLVIINLELLESYFIEFNFEEINNFKYEISNVKIEEIFETIDFNIFKHSPTFNKAEQIKYLFFDFKETYEHYFNNYYHLCNKELHFYADAAKGKTHISCDIAFRQIDNLKPAIFITGDKFSDESSITEAIKKILDIRQEYSFDDFLQALDIYASIVKSKIPIIIDGLNETTFNNRFSLVWKNHLSSIIEKINNTEHLIIITTCRSSYVDRIWKKSSKDGLHYLFGFSDYITLNDAINKYFTKYKLKTDLTFAPLEKFRGPIFFKLFCEIKNPNWKTSGEIEVNLDEELQFDIFESYINLINERVTTDYPFIRDGAPFIKDTLKVISQYLWENDTREIPIDIFYQLIDGNLEYDKDKSKADIFKKENLIVDVDNRGKKEFVKFTYQILSGYLIADYLLSKQNPEYFLSEEFENKMYKKDIQHPLYDDIIESLVYLLPIKKDIKFHDIIKKRETEYQQNLFSRSVTSLFELKPNLLNNKDIELIEVLFKRNIQNKNNLIPLFFKTISNLKHPLNAVFFSKMLFSQKLNERDITWSEYIRNNSPYIEDFILNFEKVCRTNTIESELIIEKLHLMSKIIVWMLTSTNRNLRDKSTRALYYYGRKFPNKFISLVFKSLEYNDPYIWERTLAAIYGIVMAEHNSTKTDKFREQILPNLAKNIYELIFKEQAPHSTTHVLARDYARRIIEIGLLHHQSVLTAPEIKNIRPPYTFGGIRRLGIYKYGKRDYGVDSPLRMDFSNYTIGRIVTDSRAYDNNPEKKKVRKQINWRIKKLGWNKRMFFDIDNSITIHNDNYRGSSENTKIERYGKKYSWIAFYENAGLRDDLGLIERKWNKLRIDDADIDPSFPEKPENEVYYIEDLLGDRKLEIIDWFKNSEIPNLNKILVVKNLKGNTENWICLDAYISQEDKDSERSICIFIQAFMINEVDYKNIINLLKPRNFDDINLPQKRINYYTFAGELYYCNEATEDNIDVFSIITSKKKVKIKKGKPGYYPSVLFDFTNNGIKLIEELPEDIEKEVPQTKNYNVLMPVMEYYWENFHSSTNNAGQTTVVGKEIANHLRLVNQPQSFDLIDSKGNIASKNIIFDSESNYNNNHNFVYIRKDLIDKYLSDTKSKLFWVVWGERLIKFKTEERREEFFKANNSEQFKIFHKVIEYP
jgi:hypothetical protein